MLVIAPDSLLGTSANVKITSVGRWSVFGYVIEGSVAVGEAPKQTSAKLQKEDIHQQVEEAGFCATDSCGAWDAPMRHNSVAPNDVNTRTHAPQTCGDVTRQEALQPKRRGNCERK